jgi:DNA polymerase-3 subunit delta'
MQRKDVLPHALLLSGRAGIGKHQFALDISAALLCHQPNSTIACGNCSSCTWLKEGLQPDFKLIAPENGDVGDLKKKSAKKTQISVEQIRHLYDYLSLSNHQTQSKRIVLISPAETLNIASANALLKILEEPPTDTIFILVTSQPHRLLATITSRCQVVSMLMPSQTEVIDWLSAQDVNNAESALHYAGGSPLQALAFHDNFEANSKLIQQLEKGPRLDPFSSAPLFLSFGMERALEAIQKWTFDLLNVKLLLDSRYHTQQASTLQALCKSVNLTLLLRFQQSLVEMKKTASHPLSNEMQLENLLLKYTTLFKA